MWQPGQYRPPADYMAPDVKQRMDAGEIVILDVREPDEWDDGHIPGAYWIPLGDLEQRFAELDRDKDWVCVCHLGQRSAMAADFLAGEGFRVGNMLGGMAAWGRLRLPQETGRGTPKP